MPDSCPVCGSTDVLEIKCKVVCRHCGTILQSCADLYDRDEWRGMRDEICGCSSLVPLHSSLSF